MAEGSLSDKSGRMMVRQFPVMSIRSEPSDFRGWQSAIGRAFASSFCLFAAVGFADESAAQSATSTFVFFRPQTLISPTIPTGYDRGANVSIDDEQRPDYEFLPIQLGSLNIHPQLDTFIGRSSNVLLSNTNPKSDIEVGSAVSFYAKADWGTSGLNVYAKDIETVWLHTPERSVDQGEIDASFSKDISDTLIGAVEGAFYRYGDNNPIGTVNDLGDALALQSKTFAASRLQYTNGHFSQILSMDFSHFALDPTLSAQTGLEENFVYNHNVSRIVSQTEYAFTPSFSIFGQASIYWTSYPFLLAGNAPNFGSVSYRGLVGVSLDLAGILRGQISAGFGHRNYNSPIYTTPTRPVIATKLEFFPDKLNNVTITATKDYDDGTIYALSPEQYTIINFKYEREIKENILLGLQITSTSQTTLAQNLRGSRNDSAIGGSIILNYIVNHHISFKIESGFEKLNSNKGSVFVVDIAPNTEFRQLLTVSFRP